MPKLFVCFLFLCLLFGVLNAEAVEPAGSGAMYNPYMVANLNNLQWISENYDEQNWYIKQTVDINASSTSSWNDGQGFMPIGATVLFVGNYDGQGHTISGLYINNTSMMTGLFRRVGDGGKIANLNVIDAEIYGTHDSGIIVGMNSGSITNCTATGVVTAQTVDGYRLGGVAGWNFSTGTITDCWAEVDITGLSGLGGLVGNNSGAVTRCYSSGSVQYDENATVTSGQYGGLAGGNFGSISQSYSSVDVTGRAMNGGLAGWNYNALIDSSYATGNVNGLRYVGGLVGNNASDATIGRSYATGTIIGEQYAGGLVGYNSGDSIVKNSYATGGVDGDSAIGGLVGYNYDGALVQKSYSYGVVGGTGTMVGGLVGWCDNASSITDCCYDNIKSGQNNSAGCPGYAPYDMQLKATFTSIGWDFIDESDNGNEDIWVIDGYNNSGYPYLSWQQFTAASASTQQDVGYNNTDEHAFDEPGIRLQFTGNHNATMVTVARYNRQPQVVGSLPAGIQNVSSTYWRINSSAGAVGQYNITFDTTGITGIEDFASLRIIKRDDEQSAWQDVITDLGATLNFNEPYLTVQGLGSFSEFALGGSDTNTLPVTLSSFSAVASNNGNNVNLSWVTGSETNMLGFNVMRGSQNSLTNAVRANPGIIGAGNQTSTTSYNYTDTVTGLPAGHYYYWLQMVGNDGVIAYSQSREINLQPNDGQVNSVYNDALIGAYPNPFNPSTTVSYTLASEQNVKLSVYNTKGQLVTTLAKGKQQPGPYTAKWDGTNSQGHPVASGLYFIRLQAETFTSTNKAMLLK